MTFLLLALVVAILVVLGSAPWVIRRLAIVGLVGADMNKPDRPLVPAIGGIAVIAGVAASGLVVLVMEAVGWIALDGGTLLAGLTCVMLVAGIGLVDDLLALPPVVKGILPMVAAIPLVLAERTVTSLAVPGIGALEVGLLYPLVLVPIGVTGAANVTNMLAGFNGLEAGMGAIACAALLIVAIAVGQPESATLLVAMGGALAAFLAFNWYPARTFMGDTGTLAIGATLAAATIVGHYEVAGMLIVLPYVLDFVVKARNRFPSRGWWGTWADGRLTHTGRPVGLAQVVMRLSGGVTERGLVSILIGLELVAAIVVVALFALG